MPYEITFSMPLPIEDPEKYFNECCSGGDVVSAQLLPVISQIGSAGPRYTQIQAAQEDWGWFIWFREGAVRLAIDICCDDPVAGAFRIHLIARRRRWLFTRVVDTTELERLKDLVIARLSEWVEGAVDVRLLDEAFC